MSWKEIRQDIQRNVASLWGSTEGIAEIEQQAITLRQEELQIKRDLALIKLKLLTLETEGATKLREEFYTVDEISLLLGQPKREITRTLDQGRLVGLKFLGRWYVEKNQIDSEVELL